MRSLGFQPVRDKSSRGSRRHLRGRIAFQANFPLLPAIPGRCPGHYSRYSLPGYDTFAAQVAAERAKIRRGQYRFAPGAKIRRGQYRFAPGALLTV